MIQSLVAMFVRVTTHVVAVMNINCFERGQLTSDSFFMGIVTALLIVISVLALSVAPRASAPIINSKNGLPYKPKPAILRRLFVATCDKRSPLLTRLS